MSRGCSGAASVAVMHVFLSLQDGAASGGAEGAGGGRRGPAGPAAAGEPAGLPHRLPLAAAGGAAWRVVGTGPRRFPVGVPAGAILRRVEVLS